MIAERTFMQGRYLTTEEVAQELRVTEHTVRRWIREGAIKAVRMGKEYRITRADLEAFIQSLEDKQAKDE